MPRIRKSIDIEAPRERVFAMATDPAQQSQWTTFLQQVEVTAGDGKSVGTRDRCLMKVGPRAQEMEAEWTEYRENEAFARRATSGMDIQGRMTFTPLGEGSTRVDWTIEYTPPMGALGLLVDALFMSRVFQNQVEDSLERLKAQLEG